METSLSFRLEPALYQRRPCFGTVGTVLAAADVPAASTIAKGRVI